jgi:hypothetical protein
MMTTDMDRSFSTPGAHPGRPGDVRAADRQERPPAPASRQADRSGGHPVRRIVAGVLVGALTMLGVATLDAFGAAQVPVLGSFAALPAAAEEEPPEPVEIPPPPTTAGTCLTWTQPDAVDTASVDCAQPHLFEQAGVAVLQQQMALPDDRRWRQLVNERCTPVVRAYLRGRFDPDGKFRVGALKPAPAKWAEGDREMRCGLQTASRSGALYPKTGRVADQDQSAVFEPGTCLGIDGRTIGDPVDCAEPHAVEAVGVVDLSEEFPDAFPAVGDQDGFLQPTCAEIADEYAGGAEVIADKNLTVYWDNLTEESWRAGSRKVNCNLAALLPDRSGFAPVTGSVRGEVAVGDKPAPPAVNTPQPGTPVLPSTAPAAGEAPADEPPAPGEEPTPEPGTTSGPPEPEPEPAGGA